MMDRQIRDLLPGGAVRHWLLSSTLEERYDVADRPMEGRMDARFFMTSLKNFIPHEYPCRTEFVRAYRDRKPEPAIEFTPDRRWSPFGDDRVDLSGFWFRATRVETVARTVVRTERAGAAKFRLGTCGGAILRVNGVERLWMSRYQRNLEDQREVTVDLVQGDNEIEIWFADLCERDARYFFQLDYLEGPAAVVAVPVPVPVARADALERILEGMRFERSFFGEGEVALLLPEAAPAPLEVEIEAVGDFISHGNLNYRRTLATGARRLELGRVEDLPSDYLQFNITLIDGELRLSRRFGVEICDVAGQGEPPEVPSERVNEALTHIARHGEHDTIRALARLAVGLGGAETDAMIADRLTMIVECHDCADFQLVPLLWGRIRWGDSIGVETRDAVDQAILNYRYWMDEPGNDVQWYFSENHALLFHTACYLAGGLFPDAVFRRSGRTGVQQRDAGRARLREWLDHFEACEMAEWNSAPYFPIDLKGLCALYALAPDADIAERARLAILRLLEIISLSCHQGLLTASQGRSYEHTLRPGRTLEISGIARMLWGRGWFGRHMHALPQLALCLRDHGLTVPEHLRGQARRDSETPVEWRYTQGEGAFAALYHHKSRHYALGTLIGYRAGEWGYQETVLHGRLGSRPEAQFWINHPGEVLISGFGRPSYWGGCGTLPRVWSFRGLSALRFSVRPEQPGFTHLWLPEDAMDEIIHDGNRLVARSDGGLVLFVASGPIERVTEGPTAGCEFRLPGREGTWVVRVSDIPTEGSAAAFAARTTGLVADARSDGGLILNDPDLGTVRCLPDGMVSAGDTLVDHRLWTMPGEIDGVPVAPLAGDGGECPSELV